MNSLKLKLFIVAAAVLGGSQAFAQNVQLGPEWGEDATQEQRFENAKTFNYYRDAYNVQNYSPICPNCLRILPAAHRISMCMPSISIRIRYSVAWM